MCHIAFHRSLLYVRVERHSCLNGIHLANALDEGKCRIVLAKNGTQLPFHIVIRLLVEQADVPRFWSGIAANRVLLNLGKFGGCLYGIIEVAELVNKTDAECLLACPYATFSDDLHAVL